MKRAAALLAVLAILVLATVWALARRDGEPAPRGTSAEAPVAAERAASEAEVAAVSAPEGARADVVEQEASPAGSTQTSNDGRVEHAEPDTDPAAPAAAPAGVPVLVVSADGAPVEGVSVALFAVLEGMGEDRWAEATSDAAGRASLVVPPEELEKRALLEKHLGVAPTFRVEAQVLLPERPAHELGAELAVPEPIRLVLPAAGGLRVRVVTQEGAVPPEGGMVFPSWRPAGSDAEFERGDGAPRTALEDGVATVPHLPLGMELRLSVSSRGYHGAQVDVAGPTRPGEVVEVEVALGPPMATVAGRLVGEDGAPLTGVEVLVAVFAVARDAPADAEPQRVPWLWTPLDGDGRFAQQTTLEPDATQRLVVAVHEESRSTSSAVDRYARFDGALALPPGETVELGTLVLRPHAARRLLVAGRVVAADGSRPKGVGVDVRFWDPKARRSTRLTEDRVEVGPDGEFEAYTILEEVPEPFTVGAGARGWLGASREARLGERGIELVLARGGGLAGRFVTSDPAALSMLAVRLESEGFAREPDVAFGAFRVESLPPGTYSVVAKGHGTDWRYGVVEGVEVPAGGTATDPRLARIDLGDACRVLRLDVRGPDGAPIAERYVAVEDAAGDGGDFRTRADGALLALVPASATELHLSTHTGDGRLLGATWSTGAGYTGAVTLVAQDR